MGIDFMSKCCNLIRFVDLIFHGIVKVSMDYNPQPIRFFFIKANIIAKIHNFFSQIIIKAPVTSKLNPINNFIMGKIKFPDFAM